MAKLTDIYKMETAQPVAEMPKKKAAVLPAPLIVGKYNLATARPVQSPSPVAQAPVQPQQMPKLEFQPVAQTSTGEVPFRAQPEASGMGFAEGGAKSFAKGSADTMAGLTQAGGSAVADVKFWLESAAAQRYLDVVLPMVKDGRIPENEMEGTMADIKRNQAIVDAANKANYERTQTARDAGDVYRGLVSKDTRAELEQWQNESGLPAKVIAGVAEAIPLMAGGAVASAAGSMVAGPAGGLLAGWQAMAGTESANFRNETTDALVGAGIDAGIANQYVRKYANQYGQMSGIVEHLGNALQLSAAKIGPKAAMDALKKTGAFKVLAEKFFGGLSEGAEEAIQTGLSNYLKKKMVEDIMRERGEDVAKSIGKESVLAAGGMGALVGLVLQSLGLPGAVAGAAQNAKADATAIQSAKSEADRLNAPASQALSELEKTPTEAILGDLEASGEAERVTAQDLVNMGIPEAEAKAYMQNRIAQGKPTNISGIGQENITPQEKPVAAEPVESISPAPAAPEPPQAGIKAPPAPEAVREPLAARPETVTPPIEKGGVSIFTNDETGEQITGTVVKETKKSVVVQTEDGKRTLPKDVWAGEGVAESAKPVVKESLKTESATRSDVPAKSDRPVVEKKAKLKTGQQWRELAGEEANAPEQVTKARTLLDVIGTKPVLEPTGLQATEYDRDAAAGEPTRKWYSAGSYYPEGWNKQKMAKLKNALRDLDAGKPMRLDQVQLIDEAARTVDSDEKLRQYRGPDNAEDIVEEEKIQNRGDKLPVSESDIDTGDLVFMNGEWYRAENTPDGTTLLDGKEVDLNHSQEVGVGALFKTTDGEPYQVALKQYREQEAKKKDVTKSVSPSGQSEFIGQDEGGFRLVGETVKQKAPTKTQEELQGQMFSTKESRGRALDELDAKGPTELKRIAEREGVDLEFVKPDAASIRTAIRSQRNAKTPTAPQDIEGEGKNKRILRVGGGNNALAAGASTGIDNFVPVPNNPSPGTEFRLYEKSKALIKKYGGDRRIMEGRNPRGALGVSYGTTGNIALAALNNIGVAAHETTHNADRRLKFSEKITKVVRLARNGNPVYDSSTLEERRALTSVYETYYPDGDKKHPLKKRIVEGFATFIQKYIEDPITIRNQFPRLATMILDPGGKYYDQQISDLVAEARDIVNGYHALDPMLKIRARRANAKKITGDGFLNTKDRIETFIADRIWPIEKLAKAAGVQMTDKDPSIDLREFERTGRVFSHNVHKGMFGKDTYLSLRGGEYKEIYDFNWSTLQRTISENGMEEPFNDFLVARETIERYKDMDLLEQEMNSAKAALQAAVQQQTDTGAYTGPGTIDDLRKEFVRSRDAYMSAKRVLDNDKIPRQLAEDAVQIARKTIPGIDKIEDMFDKLVRADLDLLHEVGLVDDKSYAELSGKTGYVTKKRQILNDLIDPETEVVSAKSNLGGKSVSSLKRRTGSELAILDPIYQSVKNHNEILRKAMRQHVINKLADLAEKVPDLMQKETLVVKFDKKTGKAEYPQENDPNVIVARVNGKRVPYVINKDIKKHLESVLTPEAFDITEQLLAGAARLFTKGTTSFYPGFLFSNIIVDQVAATSQTRTEYLPVISQLQLIMAAMRGSASKEAQFMREYMTLAGATQTITGWNQMSVEDARRAVTGETTALQKIAKAYQAGEDIIGAPSQGSEIFTRITEYVRSRLSGDTQFVALEKAGRITAPFHHRGSWGGKTVGRAWVRSIPYMNPQIQVIKEYAKAHADGRRGRVMVVTALVIAAKLAELIPMMMMASDDQKDKYKDLESDELSRYIFIPSRNGKDLLRFRIPEQMTPLATPMNMVLQNMMSNAGYGWSDFKNGAMAWIPDQFDVTEPGRMVLSWIPQLTKPTIEVSMNVKTWPAPRPMEGQSVQYLPPSERAYRTTSEFAKTIGKVIGNKTGLSPIKIDALLEGHFGRGVKLLTKTGTEVDKLIRPYAKESYFEAGRRIQNFYDKSEKLEQMRNAISEGKMTLGDRETKVFERQIEIVRDVKDGLKQYRDLQDEDTTEARIIRAKIIDGIDALETDEAYKNQFKKKSTPKKSPTSSIRL